MDAEQSIEPSLIDKLPPELLDKIIAHLFPGNGNFGHLLRVCTAFYYAALPHIYQAPKLTSKNIAAFAATLSHRKAGPLGDLVRSLNLRQVVHGAKTSQITRLVRRSARNLRVFMAPQVGFNQSAFRATGLCTQLRVLNAQAVSERVELSFFLAALSKLEQLEVVSFPKASKHTDGTLIVQWPPKLREVWLSGAVDDHLLSCPLPSTVTHLSFQACPEVTLLGVLSLFERQGAQLTRLATLYPLPLPSDALNFVLLLCPNLLDYEGYIEYFQTAFFENIPMHHPLERLSLDSTGGLLDDRNKISARHVTAAMESGRLSQLNEVHWTVQLRWGDQSPEVLDLLDMIAGVSDMDTDDASDTEPVSA
ncbi:hypothetical protein BCR37DRAFT_161656 [Protomyces lactucae-debilis]|uniref:F-box domain-containing protein n=1 Tax=Protomyces lactucae-debilis TaxID=2754530 RepID=A0A1Y2EY98_PROLT|nr:uncharacterized protein BCR37DRAFT_161656 [Protomyces lactucae-debilis]ORY76601.1 hypothetical protein BCR37DRAFT_161656 [Protomyces lactucae-debilis]